MLADISSGNTGFADVMFLVGLILFVIAFLIRLFVVSGRPVPGFDGVCVAAGLACVALGWLVL
jgi:uncharacterized membrane protein YtjA (UPF0391 family)